MIKARIISLLQALRKNKRHPYQPDVEISLAGPVKWLARKLRRKHKPLTSDNLKP